MSNDFDIDLFEKMFHDNKSWKVDTEKYLTEYYKLKGNNPFKAAEYSQENIPNFVSFVEKNICTSEQNHISFIFNKATKDIILFNEEYFYIKKIYQNLLNIEWRDFEFLSSIVIEKCFGAYDVKITQPTADGGVDFEGKISIQSIATRENYGIIEVYGQSKKYANNVGRPEIDKFIGTANRRKKGFKTQLFMFFTTSDFASEAKKELIENGFIGLNGFQIATLIFKHKEELLKSKSDIIEIVLN